MLIWNISPVLDFTYGRSILDLGYANKFTHEFRWTRFWLRWNNNETVYTVDDKHVGHIDALESEQFIVKDKRIHARYYRLDRELLEEYQNGKVKLKITEQELNSNIRETVQVISVNEAVRASFK